MAISEKPFMKSLTCEFYDAIPHLVEDNFIFFSTYLSVLIQDEIRSTIEILFTNSRRTAPSGEEPNPIDELNS